MFTVSDGSVIGKDNNVLYIVTDKSVIGTNNDQLRTVTNDSIIRTNTYTLFSIYSKMNHISARNFFFVLLLFSYVWVTASDERGTTSQRMNLRAGQRNTTARSRSFL